MMSAAVADLGRGDALIVERVDDRPGDWYVQVLLREDNTFQLEYRDGVGAEHYQTRTVSRDKVVAAVLGWARGDRGWRDAFQWINIGDQFAAEPETDTTG